MGRSIVFIDARVDDIDTLIAGLAPDTEVALLDAEADGLDQIVAKLQGRSSIDSIHIISHGSAGRVRLGSTALDSSTLSGYSSQLAAIGQSLTESGDILLYGCNVAAGDVGVQFIGSLAQAMGADVAASTDLTGAAALGGNWILEAETGPIEAAELSEDLNGLLDIGPLPHPESSNQLGSQTQELADPVHSVEIGMLFATLVYGDQNFLANLRLGSDIDNYNGLSNTDAGFDDNYRLFFDNERQLDQDWQLLTPDLAPFAVPRTRASYTEEGGLYHSYVDTLTGNDQDTNGHGNSNAILVQGGDTLVFAFRGTDAEDEAVFAQQTFSGVGAYRHYEAFRPLIEAAYAHAKNPSNGVEHIVFAGHSLGGAMADIFTAVDAWRFAALPESDLAIVSVASPGIYPEALTSSSSGFASNVDQSVVNTSGLETELISLPDFYFGVSHNQDRVHGFDGQFPEQVFGTELSPTFVLSENLDFPDTYWLQLPNISNQDVTNPLARFEHGFGAHHNGLIYWKNIHELANSPLAEEFSNNQNTIQNIIFGVGRYAGDGWFTGTGQNDRGVVPQVVAHQLDGTYRDDFILGLEGDDVLVGSAGNDLLDGGADNDSLYGQAGLDQLDGGPGTDYLYGGTENDTLNGGAGNDFLYGQDGKDTLIVGVRVGLSWSDGGADYLSGGNGDDIYMVYGNNGSSNARPIIHDANNGSGGGIDTLHLYSGGTTRPDFANTRFTADFSSPGVRDRLIIETRDANSTVKQTVWVDGMGTEIGKIETLLVYQYNTPHRYDLAAEWQKALAGNVTATNPPVADPATITVDDYAESVRTLGQVAVGGSVSGTIEKAADADWYQVNLVQGRSYQFDLKGVSTNSGTLADPFMRLRDDSGDRLKFDDNAGDLSDARLIYTADRTGLYFLSVGSAQYLTGTGTYQLFATQTSTTPVATNSAPVVVGTAQALTAGTVVAASSLFHAVDNEGDTIASYTINDAAGPGYFQLSGVRKPEGSNFNVTAAEFANLQFVVGAAGTSSTFTVKASDGSLTGIPQSITVVGLATAVTTPPVLTAQNDTATTSSGSQIVLNVLSNDDTRLVRITDLQNEPSYITIQPGVQDLIIVTTPDWFTGSFPFSYTATDGRGGTATATVTLTIIPAVQSNHAPIVQNIHHTLASNQTDQIDLLLNSYDPDNESGLLTIQSYSNPGHGTLALNGTLLTYTPNVGFVGDDTFSYVIRDPHGAQASGLVTLTVAQALQAVDDVIATNVDAAVEFNVLQNDKYSNNSLFFLQGPSFLGTLPTHGTLIFNADGYARYTPNTGYTGVDTFSYRETYLGTHTYSTGNVTIVVGSSGQTGGAGADILTGGNVADALFGNGGNDILWGGAGNDILDGGAGFDTVSFVGAPVGISVNLTQPYTDGTGAVNWTDPYFWTNDGLGGRDSVRNIEGVIGSEFADVIRGNSSANRVQGNGGDDNISVGGGDDTVFGGDGNDTVQVINLGVVGAYTFDGGNGNDYLVGGANRDVMDGGDGNDSIDGWGGSDVICGREGDDRLRGDGTLDGGDGNDVLSVQGGIAASLLIGGNGNDDLSGGPGNDILEGGGGNDTLRGGQGDDRMDGGIGTDMVDFRGDAAGVTVDLASGFAQTSSGFKSLVSIETVYGSWNAADRISGSDAAESIFGDYGSDTLIGRGGNDTIDGGTGDDWIEGDSGVDSLSGGSGVDRFVYLSTADGGDVITGFVAGAGGDLIDISGILSSNGYAGSTPGASGYLRFVSSGNDTLIQVDQDGIATNSSFETLATLTGVGATTLTAANFSTTVDLAALVAGIPVLLRIDVLTGIQQPATDAPAVYEGNAGSTPLVVNFVREGDIALPLSATVSFEPGAGLDATDLVGGLPANGNITFAAGQSTVSLTLNVAGDILAEADEKLSIAVTSATSANSPTVSVWLLTEENRIDGNGVLVGTTAADVIVSHEQDDVILADAGDDAIAGSAGADYIDGGDGNDSVDGGSGSDTLAGGAGDDTLRGEEGSDTFVVWDGAGSDVITDFTLGDCIRVVEANFVEGLISHGTGTELPANQAQISADGLHLFIGINPTAGAEIDVRLNATVEGLWQAFGEYLFLQSFPVGRVVVSGSVRQGQTLSASSDLSDANGLGAIDYQWQASSDGSNWANLSTGSALSLDETLAGKQIKLIASYTDGYGIVKSMTSASTTPVPAANGAPLGNVAITGTAAQNQILTASNTLTDTDGLGTITYQWQASSDGITWDNISTGSTLLLVESLVSKQIKVVAAYTDNYGTAESVASSATSAVANINDAPTLGTPIADQRVFEGRVFDFTIPNGSFRDVDVGDNLIYLATRSDGGALPSWLSFDAETHTFSGTPTSSDIGSVGVQVSATDGANLSIVDAFNVSVTVVNNAPVVQHPNLWLLVPIGSDISYTVPLTTFYDADPGDSLTWSATFEGGDSLDFDPDTHVVSGIPSLNGTPIFGNQWVFIHATDMAGVTAQAWLNIVVSQTNSLIAPSYVQGQPIPGNYSIIGNAADNLMRGSLGIDTLDGGSGNDSMAGGAGDDTYIVDSPLDRVSELVTGGGSDIVLASVSYALPVYVEHLTLTGTDNVIGTGNGSHNRITGNSGHNTLNGGAGIDSMAGGLGDDIYLVDNLLDAVTELADAGTDTIRSAVNYILSANVENLVLTGIAINATGNELANTLTGNAGANRLDGGTGADTLAGLAGNDSYVINDGGDVIQETATGGMDTVISSIDFDLSRGSYATTLENLTLAGTALIGTGNALANRIIGNTGNNLLTGNAGNDRLEGGAGNDTLDGGTGNDALIGGLGDDTYVVDRLPPVTAADGTTVPGDAITEVGAGGGTDTVRASLTYTLGANLENLILTGTALNGTGNASPNLLTGNSGNNTLDGKVGIDSYAGGAGNDLYILDQAAELANITEALNEGTDTVRYIVSNATATAIPLSLAAVAYIENLAVTGTGLYDLTGNALDNLLTGNAGNNTLTGGAGNDTLDGGAGLDSLVGGLGDDTYVIDRAAELARITEDSAGGSDTVRINYAVAATTTLNLATLTNIENVTVLGAGAFNLTGTDAADNTLRGNISNNVINGGAGNDILIGGGGRDTLTGGTGADVFGIDRIAALTVAISDFSSTDNDRLALGQTAYGALFTNGALTDGVFGSGANMSRATSTAMKLFYDTTGGRLFYDRDGSGTATAVQVATFGAVGNRPALATTDFVVLAA